MITPKTRTVARTLSIISIVCLMAGLSAGSAYAATITVTGTSDGSLEELVDNGTCDLREAIEASNSDESVGECSTGLEVDTIAFNIGAGGLQTINPLTELPTITDPVVIDGKTQPGCGETPCIEIDGCKVDKGLTITAGNSTVRGLVVNRSSHSGIHLTDRGYNVLEGNYIGLDASGTEKKANGAGISISATSSNNRIGGIHLSQRNVISGNFQQAIIIYSGRNRVLGNYIGTNPDGLEGIGNRRCAVWIFGNDNAIGGVEPGALNVISGNGSHGICLDSSENAVLGNLIGVDRSGSRALPNQGSGIYISNASRNRIGGTAAGEGNVISANEYWGIVISGEPSSTDNIVQGNLIGTDSDGLKPLGNGVFGVSCGPRSTRNLVGGSSPGEGNVIAFNGGGVEVHEGATSCTILSNRIFSNRRQGIDLIPNGLNPNDFGDLDAGANQGQNFPVIAAVTTIGGSTAIQGNLESRPNSTYVIELFLSSSVFESGYGDGEELLGRTSVRTDGSGWAEFEVDISRVLSTDKYVTSTATDAQGNTSEFSRAYYLGEVNPTPTTITVDSIADGPMFELDGNGSCDLREALQAANTNIPAGECHAGGVGTDTIAFNIGPGGLQTIQPTSEFPTITDPVVIDGRTQPNCGDSPCIEISGSDAGFADGLTIVSGNSTVRGLIINSFYRDGIVLRERGDNVVEGNFIGVDALGKLALENGYAGIEILGSPNNTIGGSTTGSRNIISGCWYGVYIQGSDATGNTVAGNYIGVDVSGTEAIPNKVLGVWIRSDSNVIGGTSHGEGNVISGNGYKRSSSDPDPRTYYFGIGVWVFSGEGNRVVGNFIGTDKTGETPLGNKTYGVSVGGEHSVIGGTDPGSGNVISGNGALVSTSAESWQYGAGVCIDEGGGHVVQGNHIGTDRTGTKPVGNWSDGVEVSYNTQGDVIGGLSEGASNTIAFNGDAGIRVLTYDMHTKVEPPTGIRVVGNSIFSNGQLGIDLMSDGSPYRPLIGEITPNDPGDVDTGPNSHQNFPVLTAAVRNGDRILLAGRLESSPDTEFEVDFYANREADPSGHGEGEVYLGQTIVTTNELGEAEFVTSFPIRLESAQYVTATAADPEGSTSEFSLALAITDQEPLTHERGLRRKTPYRAQR
ncbi:MAG: hypothetical protein GY906_32115 [bacterium]|nr:hypothetical protein [bacterium]